MHLTIIFHSQAVNVKLIENWKSTPWIGYMIVKLEILKLQRFQFYWKYAPDTRGKNKVLIKHFSE